jgi:hypothetical protein
MSSRLGSWGCGRSMPTWSTPAAPTPAPQWLAGEAMCGLHHDHYVQLHARVYIMPCVVQENL